MVQDQLWEQHEAKQAVLHLEEWSEGVEVSPPVVSAPGESLPRKAEDNREALSRQQVIDITQGILERVHAICLQALYKMGCTHELDRTLARALMAEFVRVQLVIRKDLTKSLIALRLDLETSSQAFLLDVTWALNLHPTDPAAHQVKALLQRFQEATSLKVHLPLLELQAAREAPESFLHQCLQEIGSRAETRELVERLAGKMMAQASLVRDPVSIPEVAQQEVALRVNTGLAANPSLEANVFSGILEGVTGRLGLSPSGMTDPPVLARAGVSRQWAATLQEAVQKTEGKVFQVGPVTHDILPSGLRLDYDLVFETRGLDVMAPVLMHSLLSGLTGNIGGLELPRIPTLSASSEAGGGMVGLARVPLKSGAPGPSREADLNLLMPASVEEVLKYEPSSRGMSQHDSPVPEVNPEDIAEIVIDDSDDLNQTIEEPQAAASPVREPTPRKKRGLDDLVSSSSPSKKHGTQEEDTSAPASEDDLPKGVKLEDILPKRYDTLCCDHGWVHEVRCSLLGLEAGTIPSREDIDSSVRFTPQATCKETESPEIIAEHWLPVLWEEGLLMECPPDQFTSKPSWVPLYTLDSLTKYLPAALSTFSGSSAPSLSAVVPPQHPGSTDREFLLMNFHRHGCLVRQFLTVGG